MNAESTEAELEYLDSLADVISSVIEDNGFQKIAADAIANAIVTEYKFRDILGNLWEDANYGGYAKGRVEENPSQHNMMSFAFDMDDENPFQHECCPTTKGGYHKFRCPENGVQQMVVPVNVSGNSWQVSPVYTEDSENGSLETPESQD